MKTLILSVSLSLYTFLSWAQIINTIAGNGTSGSSGNGSQATLCELFYLVYIINDNLGITYISDNGSHEIGKIDLFGVIRHLKNNRLKTIVFKDDPYK